MLHMKNPLEIFSPLLLVFTMQVTELSMGELLMHSTVSWLNPFLSLGKARKDIELTVFGWYSGSEALAVTKSLTNITALADSCFWEFGKILQ